MLLNKHIKEILEKLQSLDNDAFDKFASSHPVCFKKGKENWLFPMMYDYYKNTVHNEIAINLIMELGMFLHNYCQNMPLFEVTHIDRSLCIDDSYVEEYVRRVQNAQNKEPEFRDINSPWKTRGISLSLYGIPSLTLNSIVFDFKDREHPYILADIAGIYVYAERLSEGLNFLYRSTKLLSNFPNRYWNSEYGLAGAANTFRLLLLMCPTNQLYLYRKIYAYDYMYLTKLACTAKDEVFQHEAYVNRASIVISPSARYVIPMSINPNLLYISDTYYAHYCNSLAEFMSAASGWNYNMKSLTYYRHASIRPNYTGGYVDIEDKTYGEIVSSKHEQAKVIAFDFYRNIFQKDYLYLTDENIETLFKVIQSELRYNYKSIRNRVLNYKKY